MRKIVNLILSFLFLSNYIYADYTYTYQKDLTVRDILYIQNLTEYSTDKGQFSYANSAVGFDTDKLSYTDKKLLVQLLKRSGIFIGRSAFKDNGIYEKKLKGEIKVYEAALQSYISRSAYESINISNLEFSDVLELGWNTALNLISATTDIVGTGMYIKAVKTAKTIKNANYITRIKAMKNFHKNEKIYRKVIDALEVFSSKEFILLSNLINNGFVLTNQMKKEINSDKLLQEQLNGLGINVLGKLGAGKLSSSVIGTVASGFVGKFFEALSILFTRVISGGVFGDDEAKAIMKDILNDLSGLIPIYGAFKAQWDKSSEIFGRLDEKPEALKAWNDYIQADKVLREKRDILNEKIITDKLKAILEYANSQNLNCFSDIPKTHRGFIPIFTLKKLYILDGKWIDYNGVKVKKYLPNDYATVGDVLKVITKVKFKESRSQSKLISFKKFLENKKININLYPNKNLTNNNLNEIATRGYVSKLITNIYIYEANQNSKYFATTIAETNDQGYLSVYTIDGNSNDSSNTIRSQIKQCKSNNYPSDWDECSSFLRSMEITKNINSFEPNKKITRYELAVMAYRLYTKGFLKRVPKFYKLREEVK